jgi:hypothetical protein
MKKTCLIGISWLLMHSLLAANHQLSLSVPYQFIDYSINKHTLGVGIQYQILLNENLAPGLNIEYSRGINSETNAVPLNSIFIFKPTLHFYFKPDFNRFFFNIGFGYALISETATALPTSVYIPFNDQFLYSLGAGYQLPIKKIRLGLSTEVGGFFKPNNTAPIALFFKGNITVGYRLF